MGPSAASASGATGSVARHQPHLLITPFGEGDVIRVDTAVRRHLEKVLRIVAGTVTYTDGSGLIGEGEYDAGSIRRGTERIIRPPERLAVAVAPPHEVTRARFLVEKLAELAVTELVWLRTAHLEGRPPRPEKTAAWVRSAVEQSRGAWAMRVGGPVNLDEVASLGTPVFAEAGSPALSQLPALATPVLCVGPEGGFASGEIPEDALRIGLASTVLRVETAAISGAVLLRSR